MSILSRWFGKLINKKRKNKSTEYGVVQDESATLSRISLSDPLSMKNHVVGLCEQIIEISKDLEDVRREYDQVTAYLNDIQIVEGLGGEQKKQLEDVATQISKLITARNDYLNAEHKISDETFNLMEEKEAEIPDVIRRLKVNEKDLDMIKRDLNHLASEKVECSVTKQEREEELEQLRRMSMILLFAFGGIAILVALLSVTFEWNMLPVLIVALLATLSAAYVILRMQECKKEIKQCDVNQNYIISLENRIKIKYVNAKNAVDYTYNRFHVKHSKELIFNYEQFIEICKEREKLKQTNEDLEYFKSRLVRILRGLNLYDARIWLNYANAIIDKKEMVELKHELFTRRQFLRSSIEYNLKAISELKTEVDSYVEQLGSQASQIKSIVQRVEELNKSLGIL